MYVQSLPGQPAVLSRVVVVDMTLVSSSTCPQATRFDPQPKIPE